jgi:ATP-dependent Clp protease ATP-binding subunit ClpX
MRTAAFCDFCGKHQDYVKVLIAGNKVHICDECIDVCADVIAKKRAESPTPSQTERNEG